MCRASKFPVRRPGSPARDGSTGWTTPVASLRRIATAWRGRYVGDLTVVLLIGLPLDCVVAAEVKPEPRGSPPLGKRQVRPVSCSKDKRFGSGSKMGLGSSQRSIKRHLHYAHWGESIAGRFPGGQGRYRSAPARLRPFCVAACASDLPQRGSPFQQLTPQHGRV